MLHLALFLHLLKLLRLWNERGYRLPLLFGRRVLLVDWETQSKLVVMLHVFAERPRLFVALVVFIEWAFKVVAPRRLAHRSMKRTVQVHLAFVRWTVALTIKWLVKARVLCLMVVSDLFHLIMPLMAQLSLILCERVWGNVSPYRLVILISILEGRLVRCHAAWRYWRVGWRQLTTYWEKVPFWCLVSRALSEIIFTDLSHIFCLAALRASAPGANPSSLVWYFTVTCHLPRVRVVLSLHGYNVRSSGRCGATACSCFVSTLCKARLLDLFAFESLYTGVFIAPVGTRHSRILGVFVFKLPHTSKTLSTNH